MTEQRDLELEKRTLQERAWLHYYNRVLYEQGIITEQERNQMTNKINARKAKALER